MFGNGLNPQEPNGTVGFFYRQRPPLVCPVAARTLWDDEAFNLLLGKSGLGQALKRYEREAVTYGQRQIGLRADIPAEHRPSAQLAGHFFDHGGHPGLLG